MKALTGISGLYWIAAVLIGIGSLYMHVTSNPTTTAPSVYGDMKCYQSSGERVRPEFVVENTTVEVVWVTGVLEYEGEKLDGLAEFSYDPETETTSCKVWIRMPERVVGDADMDTAGHEFLHCLTGRFHK